MKVLYKNCPFSSFIFFNYLFILTHPGMIKYMHATATGGRTCTTDSQRFARLSPLGATEALYGRFHEVMEARFSLFVV